MSELPDSSFKELLLWLLRRRQRFRVTGMSMVPLLKPGDEVLIDAKAYAQHPPCINDIIVAQHPYRDIKLIKRVITSENGRYFLKGDNALESTDSRTFGAVKPEQILGRVTSRF